VYDAPFRVSDVLSERLHVERYVAVIPHAVSRAQAKIGRVILRGSIVNDSLLHLAVVVGANG
jgi:hypothetical protein